MNHTICVSYFQAVGLYTHTTQKAIPLVHTHHDLHQLVIQTELNHFKKSILKHLQVIKSQTSGSNFLAWRLHRRSIYHA